MCGAQYTDAENAQPAYLEHLSVKCWVLPGVWDAQYTDTDCTASFQAPFCEMNVMSVPECRQTYGVCNPLMRRKRW
eukprot:1161357-Pelagomonas_calceolata.AAC.1